MVDETCEHNEWNEENEPESLIAYLMTPTVLLVLLGLALFGFAVMVHRAGGYGAYLDGLNALIKSICDSEAVRTCPFPTV